MNLRLRVISAVILALVLLGAIWIGGFAFYALVAVVAAVGLWELAGLLTGLGAPPLAWILFPLAGWLLFRFQLPVRIQPLEVGLGAAVVMGLTLSLLLRRGVVRWAVSVGGALYVGLSLGYYFALINWRPHEGHYGARLLTLTLLAVAACDIAALFGGSAFGRHRFFPAISPKKTLEGAVAGVLGAAAVGTVLAPPFIGVHAGTGLGLGLVIALVAEAGDLTESALKREAQVKDSSALIPGHGGLLDRLDSLLFVAPAVYCFLLVFSIR